MIPNAGFSNFLGVQREDALDGAATGAAYLMRGKTSFGWQPILGGGSQRVNVWRKMDGDSFATRYFSGSLNLEYANTELHRALLESFLETISTQANTPSAGFTTYSYRPRLMGARRSLRIGLEYSEGGPFFLMHGCIIDYASFTCRLRELIKVKYEFKFTRLEDTGAAAMSLTATNPGQVWIPHTSTAALMNAGALANLTEASFQISDRAEPASFGADKQATAFRQSGRFTLSGELVEYFGSTATIPGYVRDKTEAALDFTFATPGSSKKLQLVIPRNIFRAGTPDGIGKTDLPYRATFEAQHDQSTNPGSETKLILVV